MIKNRRNQRKVISKFFMLSIVRKINAKWLHWNRVIINEIESLHIRLIIFAFYKSIMIMIDIFYRCAKYIYIFSTLFINGIFFELYDKIISDLGSFLFTVKSRILYALSLNYLVYSIKNDSFLSFTKFFLKCIVFKREPQYAYARIKLQFIRA